MPTTDGKKSREAKSSHRIIDREASTNPAVQTKYDSGDVQICRFVQVGIFS